MLIDVIKFERYENGMLNEYIVENTIDNQEKIFTDHHSRDIKFVKMFDFQYNREMSMPIDYIDVEIWVRLINSDPDLFAAVSELTNA